MRTTVCLALIVGLSLTAPARADEARKLLDQVIAAQGGADKLAKQADVTFKAKGQFTVENMRIETSGDFSVQGLQRFRWNVEVSAMGRTQNGTLVLDGDKGWAQGNGQKVEDLPKEAKFLIDVFRAVRLTQNVAAFADKAYELSHLGEMKINDRAAVGLKAVRKGQPDIDLYFDKQTLLPLRAELRVAGIPGAQQEMTFAFFFDDFKEVEGVKMFHKLKLRLDDKEMMELDLTDLKTGQKLDDSIFAKP
jgi:outer membrane lipoprotein-sorting protein